MSEMIQNPVDAPNATPEGLKRSLEMMTDLAAKYQTERDAYRALLEKCTKLIGRVASRPASEVSLAIRYTARTLLADLQSAGVEPTP